MVVMAHFESNNSSYYKNMGSRYYSDVTSLLEINGGSEHRYSSRMSGSLL